MVDDGSNMDVSNRHTVYLDFATSDFFTSIMGKWWEMDANHLPYPRSCYCPKHWPQFVRKRHQTCLDISLFQRCFFWWSDDNHDRIWSTSSRRTAPKPFLARPQAVWGLSSGLEPGLECLKWVCLKMGYTFEMAIDVGKMMINPWI